MNEFDFKKKILSHSLELKPLIIETLQVNITKLCNQACLHCHVDASPKRTEQMNTETIDKCLRILSAHNEIKNLDITGGAAELNPHFDYFVQSGRKFCKH
ncbi:MAG: radical SAM protein, partial [Ignavibacteria bacterium]